MHTNGTISKNDLTTWWTIKEITRLFDNVWFPILRASYETWQRLNCRPRVALRRARHNRPVRHVSYYKSPVVGPGIRVRLARSAGRRPVLCSLRPPPRATLAGHPACHKPLVLTPLTSTSCFWWDDSTVIANVSQFPCSGNFLKTILSYKILYLRIFYVWRIMLSISI